MLRRLGPTVCMALVVAVAAVAGLAVSASADTTLGSKLEDPYETTFGGITGITVFQEAASGEVLSAPSGGTITSWRVRSGDMNAIYELRVLRPSGSEFKAIATSEPQTVPNAEDKVWGPFSVNLPVGAGDRIALYVVKGAGAPINNTAAPIGDELNYVVDPFADGTTKGPALSPGLGGPQELLLQANFKPGPPVNTSLPTIAGEARVGTQLTASEGSWEDAASFAFQWLRCSGSCSPIAGATGSSYTPTVPDEGSQLRVDVSASGEGGKATASSALTAGVKPGPPTPAPAPSNLVPPTASGEARETVTLSGTPGVWAWLPSAFEYQWLRCASATGTECAPVAGASSASYKLIHADVGSTMRLQVTARNAVGFATAESAPTGIVKPLVLRAQLAVRPNNACSGTPVEIDASASQTPHPPLTYHFRDFQFPLWYGTIEGPERYENPSDTPTWDIGSGASPRHVYTFSWDRTVTGIGAEDEEPAGQMAFDPILFTVIVTDASGATAGAYAWLTPAQLYSGGSHSKCPPGPLLIAPTLPRIFGTSSRFLVHTATATATTMIRCLSASACVGSMSLIPATRLLTRTAAAGRTHRRPLIIAGNPRFRIRGHHAATIRARLTKEGRALLRRGKPVRAILQVTGIGSKGAVTTQSRHVTLRPG